MAKKLYGGAEIRPLETMMNRFVMDYIRKTAILQCRDCNFGMCCTKIKENV